MDDYGFAELLDELQRDLQDDDALIAQVKADRPDKEALIADMINSFDDLKECHPRLANLSEEDLSAVARSVVNRAYYPAEMLDLRQQAAAILEERNEKSTAE